MAKYYALRRYPSTYRCDTCGSAGLNPTLCLLMGPGHSPVHCVDCLWRGVASYAHCGGCKSPIRPTKRASTGATKVIGPGIWHLWNAECLCPQQPAQAPTLTATALAPAAPADDERLTGLRLKLTERLAGALHSVRAQGHDVPAILVVPIPAMDKKLTLRCGACGAFVDIMLGRFDDPAVHGTAIAFTCSKLKRGKH